jgi:phosphatidylglycerophosphatase A
LIAQTKKLITTCFYLGYLPLIPGTFASVAGLYIYILFRESFYLLLLVHCLIIILGFLLSGKTAKLFNRRDPRQIVIDEINGMLIGFLGLSYGHLTSGQDRLFLLSGFIIFRIFDALKPYPANRLQRIGGSLGIMGDDIVAGIYTNIILRALLIFLW